MGSSKKKRGRRRKLPPVALFKSQNISKCGYDARNVFVRHGCEEWQAQNARIISVGAGKRWGVAAIRIIALTVHWEVMHLAANSLLCEPAHQRCAGYAESRKIDLNRIKVPSWQAGALPCDGVEAWCKGS